MKATLYDPDTGVFGQVLEGDEEFISLNTPPSWAWTPGEFDARCQRLVALTPDDFGDTFPVVEDWRPPTPAATEWETWAWNADQKRYLPVPTPAAMEFNVRRQRDRLLAECDWVVARAVETGEMVPVPWRDYRQALRDVPLQPGFPTEINWPTTPS